GCSPSYPISPENARRSRKLGPGAIPASPSGASATAAAPRWLRLDSDPTLRWRGERTPLPLPMRDQLLSQPHPIGVAEIDGPGREPVEDLAQSIPAAREEVRHGHRPLPLGGQGPSIREGDGADPPRAVAGLELHLQPRELKDALVTFIGRGQQRDELGRVDLHR